MKTTVDLPDELLQRVKVRAVMRHRRLKDTVAELLRLGLGVDEPDADARKPTRAAITVPLFECSADAPASHMTVEELVALSTDAQAGEDLERLSL